MAQAQRLHPRAKCQAAVQQQRRQRGLRQVETRVDDAQNGATKQVVREEQSLQMVQTLLGVPISSMAFIRNLLPDKCFSTVAYTPDNAYDYEEFYQAPAFIGQESSIKVARFEKGTDSLLDTTIIPPDTKIANREYRRHK